MIGLLKDGDEIVIDAIKGEINVILSKEETYADLNPVRLDKNGITSFVSIMRGCDNMCSFCVVPFTRGRERSRDPKTIVHEIKNLENNGYKEVTLLGQNIDAYGRHTFYTSTRATIRSAAEQMLHARAALLSDKVPLAMSGPCSRCRSTPSSTAIR